MSSLFALPERFQERLAAELKPGETVAWAAQPIATQYMRPGFMLWLFFLPWTAFSIFWIGGAANFQMPAFEKPDDYFPLFGIPFLLIGLVGMASPLLMWLKARHMVYAVTNQRALAIEGQRSIKVKSYAPADIANPTRKEKPDGSGDLILQLDYTTDSKGRRRKDENGFLAVPEVKGAERAIDTLLRRAGRDLSSPGPATTAVAS